MHRLFNEFIDQINRQHKEQCVQMVLSSLHTQNIDIVTLYNEVLTPALTNHACPPEHNEISIWEEHVRTSIIRTIIECCYPFVIKERDEKYHSAFKGRVAAVCPPDELHEIGIRMVADFFTLCGYNVDFVGANTPVKHIISAIKYIRPDYVAISITNYLQPGSCQPYGGTNPGYAGLLRFEDYIRWTGLPGKPNCLPADGSGTCIEFI